MQFTRFFTIIKKNIESPKENIIFKNVSLKDKGRIYEHYESILSGNN